MNQAYISLPATRQLFPCRKYVINHKLILFRAIWAMGKYQFELLKGTVFYLSASVAAGLLWNMVSPNAIPLIGSWDTSKGVISAGAPNDPVHQMQRFSIDSVATAKTIHDGQKALFVDARGADTFYQGHIPGAISLPLRQFDQFFGPFLQTYDNQTQIVTYCSGRECRDSHELAKLLQEMGYQDTKIFIDGYEGWTREELPIEK